MLKRTLAVTVVVILVVLASLAYSFFKTPEEASAPIEAIPVVIEDQTQPQISTEAVTALSAEPTSNTVIVVTEEDTSTESDTATSNDSLIFEIVPAESEVRFIIDEILRGAPYTVVGTTDQVAGQLAVNTSDLSTVQMGPILVNARTLTTDNDFRNRAIKNQILSTDAYEFITFTPTEISGLSGNGLAGETYEFQIVGDLTIRDVTKSVTFAASAMALSETRLEGTASTTIRYDDFGLAIPASQAVSAVEDEVTLEIDFVAEANDQPEQG
jgi:polyisoprenoid-binding protein YceI